MLKSIDPIISGSLLSAIHRVKAGRWVAITSTSLSNGRPSISAPVSVERLSTALFPVLPISTTTPKPLVAWLADAGDEESLDAFFTVQGTARDAERRVLEMERLTELPAHVWDNVDTVITVDSTADFAFFVCVGGGSHEVAELLPEYVRQAA